MHENYEDITSRISGQPTWHDQNGTPRYGHFHPKKCPNIYSNHVGLFLIKCQSCGQEFQVEMHSDIWEFRQITPPSKWHYGDPPIHGCVGDTMNCDDLAVLQFWSRDRLGDGDWKPQHEFEGPIK